ncbi:hypothetical protein F5883DRAFT_102926 [Diaporthe sp. PMI_573]|nr:hypothetical protein F5883DRAFT_102926 [Diaporthaceae sp. PMI_573]
MVAWLERSSSVRNPQQVCTSWTSRVWWSSRDAKMTRISVQQIRHGSIFMVFIIIISYIHTVSTCPPVLTCILENSFLHEFLYLGIFSQYLLILLHFAHRKTHLRGG